MSEELNVLGDFVELQRGTTYKGALLNQDNNGPILLGLATIARNGGFRSDKLKNYSGVSPDKLKLFPGDLFVSLKDVTQAGDLLGSVARVPENVKVGRLTQDTVGLIFKNQEIRKDYLYWILRTPQYRGYCRLRGTGTTNLGLSRIDFLNYPIPVCDITRGQLTDLLEEIERKTILNRQVNQTLEAMAQALFKSWFVDFDPVMDNALAAGHEIPEALKAKAENRKFVPDGKKLLQKNPELAAKFPSSFVFNDTLEKWVPEGWEVKSLDEIANYHNGLALQKFRPENDYDDFLPVLKISHLKEGKTDGKEKARTDIRSECRVEDGDVIFSWSASLMVDIWCGGKAALNQHLFKVTSNKYPKWFYYLFTKHHLDEFIRIASDKAVTMGHIKREHLSEAKCAFMDRKVIDKISIHFEDLINKQISNRLNSESLTQLRNALLPQLISGKVRVPSKMVDER